MEGLRENRAVSTIPEVVMILRLPAIGDAMPAEAISSSCIVGMNGRQTLRNDTGGETESEFLTSL